MYATYTYEGGNLTGVSYPDGTSLIYEYPDPNMNPPRPSHMTGYSISGPNGTVVQQSVTYDSTGRVTAVSEGVDGRSYELVYTEEEADFFPEHPDWPSNKTVYRTTVTEQGSTRSYYYEKHGGAYVITKTEDGSCSTCAAEKSYDSDFHVTESRDNNDIVSRMTYNEEGDLTSLTEAAGTADERITQYSYVYSQAEDAYPGQITTKTTTQASIGLDGAQKVTTETYDPDTGKIVSRLEQGYSHNGMTALSSATAYEYTSAGDFPNGAAVVGALKVVDGPRLETEVFTDKITYTYYGAGGSGAGMLQMITEANGAATVYQEYDTLGNLLRKTDPNGRDTVFTYDSRGHLRSQTTTDGTTWYEYDALGNVTKITYPRGNSVSYDYGPSGLKRVSDASGRIEYGYTNGNKTTEKVYDAASVLKRSVSYDYDSNNRLRKTYQEGHDSQNAEYYEERLYDGNGNQTFLSLYRVEQTELLRRTVNTYDSMNRLSSAHVEGTPAPLNETRYTYDGQGNLETVQDPNGQVTRYSYDDLGRLGRVESPETGTTEFTHDAAGNVTVRRDHMGREISYVYDELNRVTDVTYSDGTAAVRYWYDGPNAVGHLAGIEDAAGTRQFFYDAAGRLTKTIHDIDNKQPFVTEYGYDANGNLRSLKYPSGRTVEYEYEALTDRIVKVTAIKDGGSTVLAENIAHLPFGPLQGFDYGNGIHATRDYEPLTYRLHSLSASNPIVFPTRVYAYDPSGNIGSVVRDETEEHEFTYDPVDRLLGWTKPGRTQAFSYDANGNRLTQDDSGQHTDYTYDEDYPNLLIGATGAESLSFGYDPIGNTTTRGPKVLAHDINGRMRSVDSDGVLTDYLYNIDGQRVRKTVGQKTYYEFDAGGRLIHEYRDFENDFIDYIYLEGEPLAMITDKDMNVFTVTPTPGSNGMLAPTTPQAIDYNATAVFTVTPDTGYHIVSVTGCGGTLNGNTYTTAPVTADCAITATFAIDVAYALWTRADTQQVVLWELDPTTHAHRRSISFPAFGEGTGWVGSSFARVDDSTGYLLWTSSAAGQAVLWKVDPATGALLSSAYLYATGGVGANWRASSYTHVDDTTGYVLWTCSDTGQAVLWKIDPSVPGVIPITSSACLYNCGGVGTPWVATSYEHVNETTGYVLWTRPDGQAKLWKVNPSVPGTIPIVSSAYVNSAAGAGPPWGASSYVHVNGTTGYVLWTRPDTGQAVIWKVDPSVMPADIPVLSSGPIGSAVGPPWLANGYERNE